MRVPQLLPPRLEQRQVLWFLDQLNRLNQRWPFNFGVIHLQAHRKTFHQIEKDTYRLLKEARTNGWEGEAAGLETTLIHIKDKKALVTRIREITNHQNSLS